MSVDPKGLKAAHRVMFGRVSSGSEITPKDMENAIEAYLAATSPAGDLVEKLEEWALDIDRDGTPSQAGPSADDLRSLAQVLRYQSTGVTEITDEMVDAALEAYSDAYDGEWFSDGTTSDNKAFAMRAALSAALNNGEG